MNIGNVHHMGYLVKDINKSAVLFQAIGYEIETDVFYDEDRQSDFCFLVKETARVELVEPHPESDIYPLLKTYNNAIYHVCYGVKDIDGVVAELKKNGFLLFRDKQRASAISDKAIVVFLMHIRMGIIELLQEG